MIEGQCQHYLTKRFVQCDSLSVRKMTDVSNADSCVQFLDQRANTRTHPLQQYDPKICLPLFHTAADVPSRCQASCLLFVNSTLQDPYCRNLLPPQNLCDDAIHMFQTEAKVFTDTLKHYMTVTLHHLIHFGTCVWAHNMGWMTGACHALSVASTLFKRLHQSNTAVCCTQSLLYSCFI